MISESGLIEQLVRLYLEAHGVWICHRVEWHGLNTDQEFVLDTTNIPANVSAIGLHWPTSQASSLQNIVFKLSDSVGTAHIGLYIENGKKYVCTLSNSNSRRASRAA